MREFSAGPARKQLAVNPSDTEDLPEIARAVEALSDGDITIVAVDDVVAETGATDVSKAITRTVTAGQVIHVATRRVMGTGTDAEVVALIGG